MEHSIEAWLQADGFNFAITLFGLLLLGGFGFPVPEDIPLILAGVGILRNMITPYGAFISCYAGVIVSDLILYGFGFIFGNPILNAGTKSHLIPAMTEDRVNKIREGLRKRRLLYIFIGRHLFPVRTVTFVSAGALRIPILEFIITDSVAALVSVTIMISLGYFLGEQVSPSVMDEVLKRLHYVIIVLVALGLICWIGPKLYKKWKIKKSMNRSSLDSRENLFKNKSESRPEV